jgi:ATP phosphoribosyltransferase regulatory subunit
VSTIRLPSGVRDFLPRAAARRRALADRAQAVFEAWGYQRVITPYFEVSDVLERGLGASARAAAVRFVEPGTGQIVALRPDITPQIARIVATRMADVPPPVRLCYEGAVTRLAGEAGQREVLQAGVELVGAPDRDADAEVLAVAWSAVRALDLPEVRIDLGHVAPAAHVLAHAQHPERLAAAIARKDRASVRAATQDPLAHALVTLWGNADDVLARARALPWPPAILRALDELAAVIEGFRSKVGERVDVTIDLGDLRGFDYYTGVKLAVYAGGAPDAIARGGRYDELLGKYGREMHAVGFALDLEAVAQAQRQAGVATPRGPIGVAVGDPALARTLRAAGLRVVIQKDADPAWLRGAGLDAAIAADHLLFSDDSRRDGKAAIEAAAAGDTGALIALLQTP